MVNSTSDTEYIGHFSASMKNFNDDEITKLQHFMKQHDVHMQKSNQDPADNWWYFQLPQGSTKARQWEHQGEVPRYTVRLPDDFSFTLEQSALNRDGFFTSPPVIFLEEKQDG